MNEARSNDTTDSEQRRALRWAALAAIVAVVWLVRPVGIGIFIGMLMGFAFEPLYRRAATRWRPRPAALATVGVCTLLVAVMVGGLMWLLVREGTALGREGVASLGSGGAGRSVLDSVGKLTSRVGISTDDLTTRLRALAEGAVTHAATLAESVAAMTASAFMAWFFSAVTMYTILSNKDGIRAAVEQMLPLRLEYTQKLIGELRDVGRKTLVGTVGSAVLEGLMAAIGYWIAGLPRPAFFGGASAVASLVPGVGTMLVWVPAGISLILLGHVGRGIFLLAWGAVVMSALTTYVIRPRLVGRGGGLPPLATFVALFGGAATMGVKGLIVGPVLMSVAFAVLKLYWLEERQRRCAG